MNDLPTSPPNWLISLPVDIFRQAFLLSTTDIDRFFTLSGLVDNFYKHVVLLVDKVLKSIAHQRII
jgi:hypothetical protein